MRASSRLLWVLACGRRAMLRAESASPSRRALRSTMSRSMTTAGVSSPPGSAGACSGAWVIRRPGATPRSSGRPCHDRRLERPDPLDREPHEVAGLEPSTERLVLDLEQAATTDRAAAQDLAGSDMD